MFNSFLSGIDFSSLGMFLGGIDFSSLGMFLGGIGLFLLGMEIMSEGLKKSAGDTLVNILKKSTDTKLKGFLSGFLATTILQSSTATTLLAIGFVNAGILSFGYSIWLLFGANVGTTMTAWLVAFIGKVSIAKYALPIIGISLLVKIFAKGKKWVSVTDIFLGFGILFLGLEYLQNSFNGISKGIDLSFLDGLGWLTIPIFILIGFVLTVVVQSSSASIVMIITFAGQSPDFGLMAAAAGVIGANIGTTITAFVATLGATANAKRAAMAHIFFNIVAGIFAVCTLWLFVKYIHYVYDYLPLRENIETNLALFHSFFNIAGAIIMIPLSGKLTYFLENMFLEKKEKNIQKSEFIDETLLDAPSLAVSSLEKEILEYKKSVKNYIISLYKNQENSITAEELHKKTSIIDDFVTKIISQTLTSKTAQKLTMLVESLNMYKEILSRFPSIEYYYANHENITKNEKIDEFLEFSAEKIEALDEKINQKDINNLMDGYKDKYKKQRKYFIDLLTEQKINNKDYEYTLRLLRDTNVITGYFIKDKML